MKQNDAPIRAAGRASPRGVEILRAPLLNKGTAFTEREPGDVATHVASQMYDPRYPSYV